jgi:GrpB-like predicted nucleotidyltransferase (UPF0157 family)/protein associated with RNAse G/E
MTTKIGLAAGVVELHPHTPIWVELYQAEEARLRAAISRYVLDIQHVGSTSIPGIPAKPIIDIGVAVANFEEAAVCIEPMRALGYEYKGELGIPRRHYFARGEPRTHHLHMNEIGSADWRQQIAFRDTLRADAKLAQEYATLKLRLAQQFPTDRLAYTESKSGFIFKVLHRAIPELVPPAGAAVVVRMFKTDGECYRWLKTKIETVDDDCLTTFEPPGNLIHDSQGDWVSQSAIRAYYWFDRPYVLLEVYQPDGALSEIYVHISSPTVVKTAELCVTDHELDVTKRPGQPARIVDQDEFATASRQYRYSSEFQSFCYQTAQEAMKLADHWVVKGWQP